MTLLVSILVFFLALLCQALFAGYETGFVSCNPIRIRHLAEQERSPAAAWLFRHMQRPDKMLTVVLVGTNIGTVASTTVMALEIARLLPNCAGGVQDIVSTAIAAPLLMIFAEILPKSVFRMHPNRLTLAFLPVIKFFYMILAPIVIPVAWATTKVLGLVGGATQHISPFMGSLEDVRTLVDEGADHGTIEPEEREMIHSVIDLQNTQAKEIMVPRIHVQALPDTATLTEALAMFEETGRTRVPVYHDTIDDITGVINAYDLLRDDQPENEDINRFRKEVIHVPDTLRVGDLFQMMKSRKQHLAVVTDEYGGTDGLITIEDILEEIFGEIQDEYDREEKLIKKVGRSAYVVSARATLEDVSEATGLSITDENVDTVGGWLMRIAGRIPRQGEVIHHGVFKATVLEGTANSVAKVRLDILE